MNTLFIADDNDIDRMILGSTIAKLGFDVESFSTGKAVFEALQSAGKPVLTLLDWLMPEPSGVDICRELSTNPPVHPVYCIIVTGRTNKSDIAFALDNGADDFIAKPFDIAELRARINVGMRLLDFKCRILGGNERLLEYTKNVESLAQSRAEQLVRADRLSTLGVLTAGIAHEINNPTSFVSVNIQTLEDNLPALKQALDDNPSPEHKKTAELFLATIPEILGEMKNGVTRIKNIVNGLKTYSYSAPEKNEWFCIDVCIDAALQLCANKLKYHVIVKKNLGITPNVFGDQYQFEQVFINLFTNAADAIEESGTDGTLEISTGFANGFVAVKVRDSGPGIAPHALEKIFLPFFTTKPIGKGTGLGLSISRNILHDHKGELTVENHSGGGAEFTVLLPSKQRGPA